jgi:hypothetical protein
MGVVRWQMDIKPEDLNKGNNLVSGQRKAHPNTLDKTFSGRKARCGGNYWDRNRAAAWSQAARAGIVPTDELSLTIHFILASLVSGFLFRKMQILIHAWRT